MGKPMIWSWCSNVNVKMRVSAETFFFLDKTALVQVLDWRKIGRGVVDSDGISPPSCRVAREASSREPMW